MQKSTDRERRDDYRMRIDEARAFCKTRGKSGWYQIKDISRSGACLADGDILPLGSSVILEISLPGIGDARVEGKVVRSGTSLGVAFKRLGFGADLLLDEIELVDVLEKDKSLALLLAKPGGDIKSLEQSLRKSGIPTIVATSARDAYNYLDDPWLPVTSVFVDATYDGTDLVKHFANEFPEICRIVVCQSWEWELLHEVSADIDVDGVLMIPRELELAADVLRNAESRSYRPTGWVPDFLKEEKFVQEEFDEDTNGILANFRKTLKIV